MPAPPADEAALLAQMLGARSNPAAPASAAPRPSTPAGWRVAAAVTAALAGLLAVGWAMGQIEGAWSPAAQTLAMSAAVIMLAVVAGRVAGTGLMGFGVRWRHWSLVGAAMGLGAIAWCALSLALGGRLTATQEFAGIVTLGGMAVTLAQVSAEEMLFRGAIQPAIGRVAPPLAAIAGTAAAFALLHLAGAWGAPRTALNIFLAGCWLGLLAERSHGLVAPVAAHWGWNAGELTVLGLFPNPGTGPWGALWGHDIVAGAVWGGGQEGLNASFLATMVLGAMTLALLAVRQRAEI
jgi:membrane protease YdiL (CAAX protease family)